MQTFPLLPLADVMTLMTVGGLFLAGLVVAAVTAFAFLRARSASSDPIAPASAPSDAVHEMRALGDRIESLVAQQQLQGETQRQRLAQQIDGVQQTVGEQQSAVSGLRNELRHEIGRRDAEMQEIRQHLASMGTSTALQPPATLALPQPVPSADASAPPFAEPSARETPLEPAVSPGPVETQSAFEAVAFEAVAFEEVAFEDLSPETADPPSAPLADATPPDPPEAPVFGGFEPMELASDPETPHAADDRAASFEPVPFQPAPFEPVAFEEEPASAPEPGDRAEAFAPSTPAEAPTAEDAAPDATPDDTSDDTDSPFAPVDVTEPPRFEATASGWEAADAGSDVFAPISIDLETPTSTPVTGTGLTEPPSNPSGAATWPTAGYDSKAPEPESAPDPVAPTEDPFESFAFEPATFEPAAFDPDAFEPAAFETPEFEPAAFDPAELDVAEFDFADPELDADLTAGVSGDSFDQPPAFPSWPPPSEESGGPTDGSAFDPFALDEDDGPLAPPARLAPAAPTLNSDSAWVARPSPAPAPGPADVPVFGAEEAAAPPPTAAVPAGPTDDLTVLSNVDEAVQGRLHLAGVRTLEEIAQWGRNDARRIATEVMISEDTIMQQWVFEAQAALFRRFTHGS